MSIFFHVAGHLLCLALSRELAVSHPRTVDEILKDPQVQLFAAKEVRVDALRWTLWSGYWPTHAGRLATKGFRWLENKKQAKKLSNEVLIYCSEPARWRGWGELTLWAHDLSAKMASATPLLGHEVPNAKPLRTVADAKPWPASLPLTNPMKVTLVFLDRRGRVRRLERRDILELVHAPLKK